MMKCLIFFGPPGSGKGTQAKILAEKLNYLHISVGEFLRKEIATGSELGKRIAARIDKGNLATDEDSVEVLEKYLDTLKNKNIILDGCPRRLSQVDTILRWEKKYNWQDLKAINLEADQEHLTKRLLSRSKNSDRKDDSPEFFKTRFRVYDETTKPVLDEFKKRGLKVVDINGVGTIEEVEERISEALKN